MMHRLQTSWIERLQILLLPWRGSHKLTLLRDLARALWQNRDNLGYAWNVLSRSVCDGCVLGSAGFRDWTSPGLHLCRIRLNRLRLDTMPALDGKWLSDVSLLIQLSGRQLRELGRLHHPMLREKGDRGFRHISWAEALERVAQGIRANSPERIAFYLGSRGLTNEVCYMTQKVARFLGTNNLDNASAFGGCLSSGAMKYALGVAASTCSYRDWHGTDLIVFFGASPARDQPLAIKYLLNAKRRGTKIVVVGPALEPGMRRVRSSTRIRSRRFGTAVADYWFPVAWGGDIAFLYGVLKVLLKDHGHNQDWIDRHTDGFAELQQHVQTLDWATLEKQSGLTWRSMEEFADLVRDAPNAVLVWGEEITQHEFGGDAVSMILNLGLARGYVGRAKNGLMPLHGDASLQGAAEMGAHAEVFPGGKPINTYHASELRDHYGFPVPATPGLTIAEMLEVGRRGQLRVFYCVGGDLLCSAPQADSVTRAMSNIPIRVQQDTVLTKQALIDPKQQVLLLPAKNCHEQVDGGTQTTAERRVIFSPHIPGSHEGSGEAKEPWLILRELAATVSPELAHLLHCETGRALREEIARVNPLYGGIQRLEKYGEAFQYGGPHLCAGDTFPTADGKAHFRIPPLPSREELPELLSSREPVEAGEMPDPARTLTVEEPKP